ncbi:restriction endonuclease subunit S [Streptococcus sp. SV1]|nr:restriction endonuclease subunit S [Streptococcus sp. SV1]MDN5031133.1 restriction endonuclease subunit S [Streptococcus sp. SV1]
MLPVGTVLFTSRAGIGNTAILAKEDTTNQGFQSIVPDQNKLDSYFIFSRTNELKRSEEAPDDHETLLNTKVTHVSSCGSIISVVGKTTIEIIELFECRQKVP